MNERSRRPRERGRRDGRRRRFRAFGRALVLRVRRSNLERRVGLAGATRDAWGLIGVHINDFRGILRGSHL